MNKIFAFISIIATTMFVSCGNSAKDLTSLEGNTWKLVSLNGEANKAFESEDSFTITFSQADNAITGTGACNLFFGNFNSLGGNKIKIEMGGSTKMACPDMNLEQPFFDMLQGVESFEIKNDRLELINSEKTCAVFEKFDTSAEDIVMRQ